MSVFGPTITGYDVEQRVTMTLKYWFETYLQQREIEIGWKRGSTARPRSWRTIRTFDEKNPEDATPFIAVVSDGLAEEPKQEGDGTFRTKWVIGIGVVMEAKDEHAVQFLTKHIYLPVLLKIMLQKQSHRDWGFDDAEAWASGTEWLDLNYNEIQSELERTLYNGQLTFEVEVADTINRYGGPMSPADPVEQPGSSWPNVDTVYVEAKI